MISPAEIRRASRPASNFLSATSAHPTTAARWSSARPPMWASEREVSHRSAGRSPRRSATAAAEAPRFPCETGTARGVPVLPEVRTRAASPPGAPGGAPEARAHPSPAALRASAATARSESMTRATPPAAAIPDRLSGPVNARLTGSTAPPIRHIAWRSATESADHGRATATRSPGPSPEWRSPRAILRTRHSSPPYVSASPPPSRTAGASGDRRAAS